LSDVKARFPAYFSLISRCRAASVPLSFRLYLGLVPLLSRWLLGCIPVGSGASGRMADVHLTCRA
jgi:hypothetical protein